MDDLYQQLKLEILNRARVVFLWVYLVVRSLLRGLRHEDTSSDLQRRLAHFPPDLENFFKQMMDDIEPVYHFQTAQILQMCLAAGEALPLHTFSFLEEEAQNEQYALLAITKPWKQKKLDKNNAVTEKRVHARCRDLVKISPEERPGKHPIFLVNFLRGTVREFLLTKDMRELLSRWASPLFNPHLSLCRASVAWMKVLPWPAEDSRSCIEECPFYARQLEDRNTHTGVDTALIEEMDKLAYYHWADPMMGMPKASGAWEKGWIFTLACQAGLSVYVNQKLRQSPDDIISKFGGPALYCILLRPWGALTGAFQDLDIEKLRILLKHGANPEAIYKGTTVGKHFLRSCAEKSARANRKTRASWAEAIRLLLEHRANPNVVTKESYGDARSNLFLEVHGSRQTKAVAFIRQCCPDQAPMLEDVLENQKKSRMPSSWSPYSWIGWK
ncbi:hypothetical protein EG329_000017 [Mollisiaceae sp. DMI_Dod_QoI]|nr:hypothetical protein EG329_000017 [Helotiales sp. DMI_Dod_QoI]